MYESLSSIARTDPNTKYDLSEASRKYAYLSMILAMSVMLILGILTFMQFLGGHRGQEIPLNYPTHLGGWNVGNDIARVIVTVFGLLLLMFGFIIVNDPVKFDIRFTLGYKESVIYIGYTLRFIVIGALFCAFIDIQDVAYDQNCAACSHTEYVATCCFDVFTAITVALSSYYLQNFGEMTPEKLSTENVEVKDFLYNTLKSSKVNLPSHLIPIVAVTAPCCNELIPFDELEKHIPSCEARSVVHHLREKEQKEERRKVRKMKEEEEEEASV